MHHTLERSRDPASDQFYIQSTSGRYIGVVEVEKMTAFHWPTTCVHATTLLHDVGRVVAQQFFFRLFQLLFWIPRALLGDCKEIIYASIIHRGNDTTLSHMSLCPISVLWPVSWHLTETDQPNFKLSIQCYI